jgi:hypothetical protein
MLARTRRGRSVTRRACEHLGVTYTPPTNTAGQPLFDADDTQEAP